VTRADLLLHPVRLRIVTAFLGDRTLTTGEVAAELADVPAASVYRHIGLLSRAGVLHVVAERRVRGAVERTYGLRLAAAQAHGADRMSAADHAQAFLAFAAGMLADADRYFATDPADPARDGTGYRVAGLWLSEAEFADLARDLGQVIGSRLANPPAPGRRRRLLYTVALPTTDPEPTED
jgi:hypothetical protein